MSWLKVDDAFADHPKVVGLSLAARGLWITGLVYAGRYLTDGFIPNAVVAREGEIGALSGAELVENGLWECTDRGFLIHDYLVYNPSKDDTLRQKQARIEAGQRGGQASAQARAKASTQAGTQRSAKQTSSKIQPRTRTRTPIKKHVRDAFETWWKQYPRKVNKKKAMDLWENLSDADRQLALESLPRLLPYYATKNPEYIPHASTWLNQQRWLDEVPQVSTNGHHPIPRDEYARMDPELIY